jgi:hypothetical protein
MSRISLAYWFAFGLLKDLGSITHKLIGEARERDRGKSIVAAW